jgi:tetratricopeptide (TPR) repeat protein
MAESKGKAAEPSDEQRRLQIAVLVNRGADLLEAGRAAEAIPVLERALELDPEDISATINLAGAYIMAGKHRRAVPILERACEREPHNPMLWTNLGAAYLDRPPYATPEGEEKAIRAFERALELNPAAPHVSYNLGLICKDRGELERAIEHFGRAISANPLDRDARMWRERLKAELERQAGAGPEDPPAEPREAAQT